MTYFYIAEKFLDKVSILNKKAFINIVNNPITKLVDHYSGRNRINNVGKALGYTSDNHLNSLWMVYGDCFCADKEIYERIKDTISSGVNSIPDVEFAQTKELGKVKRVDPLGITDLRIRGMWRIANPNKTFDYIYEYDESQEFQLICLMRKEKYESFPLEDREVLEHLDVDGVEVLDVKIKSPNNPVKLLDVKLLVYKV